MKILEGHETDYVMSLHYRGGSKDGEVFHCVRVELDDGTEGAAWVSDSRPGFFKQVFVPYGFRHKSIV